MQDPSQQKFEERVREVADLARVTERKFDALLEIFAEKGMITSGDLDRLRQIAS